MNFQCPYCNQPTTITSPNRFTSWEQITLETSDKGDIGFSIHAITCPNADCRKLFLEAQLTNVERNETTKWNFAPTKIIKIWQLLPESQAKVLPEYVPSAIQEDYYEACRIRDLSPKASATLSRRCLQGMIRDFWNINKPRLKDEVDALEKLVDPLTWKAIDSVREVGNIGAHMEKDINLIIDVDPEEAQLMIELLEQLIDDWYVDRYKRQQRVLKITAMADSKKQAKKRKNVPFPVI